jgi:hypothetical protein
VSARVGRKKKFNRTQVGKVGKFTNFTDRNAFSTPMTLVSVGQYNSIWATTIKQQETCSLAYCRKQENPKTSLNRIPKQNKTRNQNQTTTLSIENNKTPKTSLNKRPNQNKTRNQNHDGWLWVQNQWVPKLLQLLQRNRSIQNRQSEPSPSTLLSDTKQGTLLWSLLASYLCCRSHTHCCGSYFLFRFFCFDERRAREMRERGR